MVTLVRSAALTHFAEVARACGLDARALLAEAGLPARCLDEPDLKVPTRQVGALLELAAQRAGEPAFGLRMAESRRISNLGPLGLLVREEPTLRSALEALVHHIHVHNEAMTVTVEPASGLVVIRVALVGDAGRPLRQATEITVAVLFRILRLFMGAGWQPRLVCFAHPAPASLAAHRRVFGRAVEFGHEFSGIVCNAADLEAPNPGADPVMARYTRQLVEQAQRPRTTASDRVRELVVLLLPRGHCRVERVAQHLGVDRRTVARWLADEGSSFSALVAALRRDLLGRYLAERSRPLTEVSALLGFSAPSAFSRWHREQFGAAASSRWGQRASRGAG
ncbi:MAG: AraC family transcriptional regulator ligand-binding domain-containing protein [Burkholderiaceae bacterium]|nr:AraC family transcriptional regulator ligand-binding domain-containing protein [Burkholderiaceae bacterium]